MAGLKGWFLAQMRFCKLQKGKGCPGERLIPCAPQCLDKVHAPQWLKAEQNPPISTSDAGQQWMLGPGSYRQLRTP
ncbi:MAG: hypothetical protein EBQ58_08620 [Betaproteobacteria bacterium]|nr:hypothetical protein [Betaproteobacteria bacterium]